MFLTVTLNPALDKTLDVARNAPNETLRARESINIAGGKGVNVARALLGLGAPVRALLPLGGRPGEHLADLARAEGMELVVVPVSGQTRLALTIRDAETGKYWHYLEPGPALAEEDLQRIRAAFLEALAGCHTVILSGSLPGPAAAPLLPWMVRAAAERGVRVAYDSFGPHQRAGLEAGPWFAKPTVGEWRTTLGDDLATEEARRAALRRMRSWGIELAILSMGREGAVAAAGDRRYRLHPAPVEEVNDLGAGDSMVAGICWAASQGLPEVDCLAWGAACGAANAAVWDPGALRREDVERLLPEVKVEEISSE